MHIYENYIYEDSTGITHYIPIASNTELGTEQLSNAVRSEAQRRGIRTPFRQMTAPRSMFAPVTLVARSVGVGPEGITAR